ncbi:MAG: hypothetical protein AAB578_09985, partial [Elusimicrobiota bacterium]
IGDRPVGHPDHALGEVGRDEEEVEAFLRHLALDRKKWSNYPVIIAFIRGTVGNIQEAACQ